MSVYLFFFHSVHSSVSLPSSSLLGSLVAVAVAVVVIIGCLMCFLNVLCVACVYRFVCGCAIRYERAEKVLSSCTHASITQNNQVQKNTKANKNKLNSKNKHTHTRGLADRFGFGSICNFIHLAVCMCVKISIGFCLRSSFRDRIVVHFHSSIGSALLMCIVKDKNKRRRKDAVRHASEE